MRIYPDPDPEVFFLAAVVVAIATGAIGVACGAAITLILVSMP